MNISVKLKSFVLLQSHRSHFSAILTSRAEQHQGSNQSRAAPEQHHIQAAPVSTAPAAAATVLNGGSTLNSAHRGVQFCQNSCDSVYRKFIQKYKFIQQVAVHSIISSLFKKLQFIQEQEFQSRLQINLIESHSK